MARPPRTGNHPSRPRPNSPAAARRRHASAARRADDSATDETQIYGIHAVEAALRNPDRAISAIWLTKNAQNRLADALTTRSLAPSPVLPKDLDHRLGADTVHQGALITCEELAEPELSDVIYTATSTRRPLVVLDQVTDPHNVGAVLRSCAVFGAAALIMTRRHSPPLAGTLAKSASGALELVPVALVQNLVKALEALTEQNFTIIGLDGEATTTIESACATPAPTAIVLGAEGRGLRQSTSAACTILARINAPGEIASLNVSNAAAVALHTHALARDGKLAVEPT